MISTATPTHPQKDDMRQDITIRLTGQEATHLALALGLVTDPEVSPLFGATIQQTLRDVRDRVLAAQRLAQRQPTTPDLLTTAQAAEALGLRPDSVRYAIWRKVLNVVPLDGRTNLISREEVDRYRREHLGQRGKRKPTAVAPN
jgi:excisionase family DNA binding protein